MVNYSLLRLILSMLGYENATLKAATYSVYTYRSSRFVYSRRL